MRRKDSVVAIFGNLADAQEAVRQVEAAGYGSYVSLVSPGNEQKLDAMGPLDQGDEMEKNGAIGAATGATMGLLASSALLVVPGIGPVLFVGAIASGITGGIVGGIVGAMSGWGVKENHAEEYEQDLRAGKTLVLASCGDPLVLAEIQTMLDTSPAEKVNLHAESADVRVES